MSAGATGGIPRYRPTGLPALFSQGFRPFFLAAALWSALAMALWLFVAAGLLDLPTHFDPPAWHAHEMLFGFTMAAMAGFLMTAIPNWTGRMPLQGAPLLCLALAWLIGRVAMAISALIGGPAAAIADLGFPALLLMAIVREVATGRNWRNLPMVGAVGALMAANALTHLYAGGLIPDRQIGLHLALAIILSLIALVGGRVIPSFTRNYLVKRGDRALPAAFGIVDRLTLALVPVGLAAWIAAPTAWITGALLLAAGAASGVRLMRWRPISTAREPLLWPLHLGYAWLALGLCLLGLSALRSEWPVMVGLHALTAGAIGTMILAVMARAALSHTGRAAIAVRGTALIHLLVSLSALLRIVAALMSDWYVPLLVASGISWVVAYALFTLLYGRILLAPRRS